MNYRTLSILVPVLAATACAAPAPAPIPLAVLDYAPQAECTPAYDVAMAASLELEAEVSDAAASSLLNNTSLCVQGEGEAARPYTVFALSSKPNAVSYLVGASLGQARIIPARVDVLDADGQITRSYGTDDLHMRHTTHGVFIRPRPDEAYVVVSLEPEHIGGSLALSVMDPLYPGTEEGSITSLEYSYEGVAVARVYFEAP